MMLGCIRRRRIWVARNTSDGVVTFFVSDLGRGLAGTDQQIADLYSVRRLPTSSKLMRRPTRGMLGNGLRVVAGVVMVGEGLLKVSTRGRTLTLKPRREDATYRDS